MFLFLKFAIWQTHFTNRAQNYCFFFEYARVGCIFCNFFTFFNRNISESFDRRGAILVKGIHEIMLKKPSETGIKTWNFSFISRWRHCKIVYIHSIYRKSAFCTKYSVYPWVILGGSLGYPWVILLEESLFRPYFELAPRPPEGGEGETQKGLEEKDGIRRKNTSKRNNS